VSAGEPCLHVYCTTDIAGVKGKKEICILEFYPSVKTLWGGAVRARLGCELARNQHIKPNRNACI
jgi:hypothetical protein